MFPLWFVCYHCFILLALILYSFYRCYRLLDFSALIFIPFNGTEKAFLFFCYCWCAVKKIFNFTSLNIVTMLSELSDQPVGSSASRRHVTDWHGGGGMWRWQLTGLVACGMIGDWQVSTCSEACWSKPRMQTAYRTAYSIFFLHPVVKYLQVNWNMSVIQNRLDVAGCTN